MEFTGERMVPEKASAEIFWEHVYRYRFAVPYVRNKRVLDIACGEGYGSAGLLKAGAASVIGVDISEETCRYAQQKYGVDTRQGDAENIPLPNGSIDVIVSFETIEHVPSPEKFLKECVRVLRPGGQLIISTPNTSVYSYGGAEQDNPYHCSELTTREFNRILSEHFVSHQMFSQNLRSVAWWSPRIFALNPYAPAPFRGHTQFRRLANALRRWICPHITQLEQKYQDNPVTAVLTPTPLLSDFVNYYAVLKTLSDKTEIQTYLVAVARKK